MEDLFNRILDAHVALRPQVATTPLSTVLCCLHKRVATCG